MITLFVICKINIKYSIGTLIIDYVSISDTRKWATDLQVGGKVPAPRSFHTLTSAGNKAVLFGGRGRDDRHFDNFDVFDLGMACK